MPNKKPKEEPGAELRMQLESITMFKVESSNLDSIGYIPRANIMAVRFKNGRTYIYPAVPEKLFNDFLASDSKGSFFHAEIKGKFCGLAGEIIERNVEHGKEKES